MSDQSQGPGWWQASDGKWYAPEQHPDFKPDATPASDAPTPDAGPSADTAPMSTPVPGAPPLGGDAPGFGDDDGSGTKKSKAPLIIALVVLVLVILGVGGFFLLSGGDDGDDEAEPTEQKKEPEEEGQPATEEGLESAATDYAEALLADDAATAYESVSEECQDIITVGEYEDIFADITGSLEESEVDLGDIEVDSVDISDFSEESGSAAVLLDGPGDFPVAGYVALPQEWTYEGGSWRVPGCDGVVLGWYTFDDVGFTTATTDFYTESLTGDVALTYPFLAAECRDEIDLDTFVETFEQQLAEAEQTLNIDFSDIVLSDVTGVEIDGVEGQGTPEFDIPSDIITALEDLDAAEDFENPDPITATYEAGIWRTTDCASYSPDGGTTGTSVDDGSSAATEGAIPLSQVGRVGDWDVKVTSVEVITPIEGTVQEVDILVEVTYQGDGTASVADLSFAGRQEGDDTSSAFPCVVDPNTFDTTTQHNPGETVSGSVCFQVQFDDVEGLQLGVEDLTSDAGPVRFLLL